MRWSHRASQHPKGFLKLFRGFFYHCFSNYHFFVLLCFYVFVVGFSFCYFVLFKGLLLKGFPGTFLGLSWGLPGLSWGFPRAFLGFPGASWAFLGYPGFPGAFLGFPGLSWGLPGLSTWAFLGPPGLSWPWPLTWPHLCLQRSPGTPVQNWGEPHLCSQRVPGGRL